RAGGRRRRQRGGWAAPAGAGSAGADQHRLVAALAAGGWAGRTLLSRRADDSVRASQDGRALHGPQDLSHQGARVGAGVGEGRLPARGRHRRHRRARGSEREVREQRSVSMAAQGEAQVKAAATYNAAADAYDSPANSFWARFGQRTIDRLGLRSGERVLDVCSGSGASAIPAAEKVAPSGSVIGVDLSEK